MARPRALAQTRGAPVISIPHAENSNHNGGQLQFPSATSSTSGTGDGGAGGDPPNNAQNRSSLLGKLLVIDPRASGDRPYTVPPDNPFVGRPAAPEIYRYGLRNPRRFSFDTETAGQPGSRSATSARTAMEEIDYTTSGRDSGANFGWAAFEGFSPYEDEEERHAGPRRHGETDLRLPPQPRRQLLGDRRSLSSPTAPCALYISATSTPTSARASCAASCPI